MNLAYRTISTISTIPAIDSSTDSLLDSPTDSLTDSLIIWFPHYYHSHLPYTHAPNHTFNFQRIYSPNTVILKTLWFPIWFWFWFFYNPFPVLLYSRFLPFALFTFLVLAANYFLSAKKVIYSIHSFNYGKYQCSSSNTKYYPLLNAKECQYRKLYDCYNFKFLCSFFPSF